MPIYTKKGDKGTTGFIDGTRSNKSDLRPHTLGEIDELNSFLGIVYSFTDNPETKKIIRDIQNNLFAIGSILAGGNLVFSALQTNKLERQIDAWEKQLPAIKNFVFPGGSGVGSLIFYTRTIARRAERAVVSLLKSEKVHSRILKYMNRLSDFLFVFARFVNFSQGTKEEIWQNPIDKMYIE